MVGQTTSVLTWISVQEHYVIIAAVRQRSARDKLVILFYSIQYIFIYSGEELR